MENEIMNFEEVEILDEVVANGKPRVGTGGAMLIGAGLTLAVGAGVKLVKKLIANHKAKKELQQREAEDFIDYEDVDEVAK
jgi:hypothetical protein